MPTLVDTFKLVSDTMNGLIDFAVADENISGEFEDYILKNNIELQKESQIVEILTEYIIEGRLKTGKSVLDYYFEKNPSCGNEIVSSIKDSFISVFKINKITKNSYEVTCLASEKNYTLFMLVKTASLRGIGLYDFIEARVIEIGGVFYAVEIKNVISSYREHLANIRAVGAIIKNPKIALLDEDFGGSVRNFALSFEECFNSDEIITSNKEIDRILDDFYLFHTARKEKVDFEPFKPVLKYFEVKEFQNSFLANAGAGFAATDEIYDIGLYSDMKLGLFVIPFLGTMNEILKGEKVSGEKECVEFFLTSNKVPSSYLLKNGKSFLNAVNRLLDARFSNIEQIIALYKAKESFSAINVLFNSKLFSKVIGYKETAVDKTVGRNDPCPCGSGKKYKYCCLSNGGNL